MSKPQGLHKIRQWSLVVVVNLLVFLVVAELLALAYYYVRGDGLFYQQGSSLEQLEEANSSELVSNGNKLYPLFGFVQLHRKYWRNDDTFKVNDYGFWSEFGEYPVLKQHDNQYIIGIFGGSVAKQLHQSARDRLVTLLQKHPFFEDKEIVVLSFAHTAYKQPQQLMILNHFLALGQPLDLVINIDGFNEVSLGVRNRTLGYAFTMPAASFVEGLKNVLDPTTMTSERFSQLAIIGTVRKQINELAIASRNTHLASIGLVLEKLYARKQDEYNRAVTAYEQADPSANESLIYLNQADQEFEQKELLEEIANHWAESSLLMQSILESRGIPYIHILQPNQYFSQRVFAEEEAQVALSSGRKSSWRQAKEGYPHLLRKSELLTSRGMPFFNGVSVFDQEQRAIYVDACCHYNQLGNEILADFVAENILEVLEDPQE